MDRNAQSRQHQHRKSIERRARSAEAMEFFNILTGAALLETVDALSPAHRERLYPPTVTLSMFMQQALDADGSCQKVVNGWAVQRATCGLKRCSTRTGGYCRARGRLALSMVSGLTRETGRHGLGLAPDTRLFGLIAQSRVGHRPHRAATAKTKAQILPMAEEASRSRSRRHHPPWASAAAKVSAIPVRRVPEPRLDAASLM